MTQAAPTPVNHSFFRKDPLVCAKGLIGARLFWGQCSGIVVETEAYSTKNDEACHTFFRPGARAFVERHDAGTAYVYLNYGMHWLLNVLVKGRTDGFVLIRALEPVDGCDLMAARRGTESPRALCSGPGKLTQAFGIDGTDHGRDLCSGHSCGFLPAARRPRIVADGRIGISSAQHLPWRFTLAGSPFVSKKPSATPVQ